MIRAFLHGLRASWRDIQPRALVGITLLALAYLAAVALLARASTPLGAPDATLMPAFALALPLMSFALMQRAGRGARLAEAVWPIAKHGHSRRYAALGLLAGTALMSACSFVAVTLAALAIAYGRTPGLAGDALTTLWIALLGAGSYTAAFGLGSSFWRNGRGRWLVLALDLVIGGGTTPLAVLFPRAHLASLLGGRAVFELPQRSSSALLLIATLLLLALAALRVPD